MIFGTEEIFQCESKNNKCFDGKFLMTIAKKLLPLPCLLVPPPHFRFTPLIFHSNSLCLYFYHTFWCARFLIAGRRQRNAIDIEKLEAMHKCARFFFFFLLSRNNNEQHFGIFTQFYLTIPESFGNSVC